MFRRALLLLLLALGPALLTGWFHPRHPDWSEAWNPIASVPLANLSSLPAAPILWIDAREPADYARSHLPGALSLSETTWETSLPAVIEAWLPEQRVVVYCDGGGCLASRATARRLRRELGLTRIVILKDGWAALVAAGKASP
ncbi:MAG: rhodanese-like domain-containing protein [Opitutaceae bacterium]|jgi:rhodanese-related sulfurtransferase